jgi:ABC-2 type transport system ATP-binding protein
MATAIEIRGLVKEFGGRRRIRAVDGVDLDIGGEEIFGLLGPNGAGKTTTIGICTTRVVATAGSVRVVGIDVAADPAAVKRQIGVVTQDNTLDRACTVFENLYFHARYFGLRRAAARRRAGELLELFQLADRARSMPDELSGGTARRLQVARAISHRPRVLFLDEPTAGLDPQSRRALWSTTREIRAQGTAVLLTTHAMDEADELSDRVAIMDHGHILACGPPAKLKRDHPDPSVNEPSLETVFIELTGRGLRD